MNKSRMVTVNLFNDYSNGKPILDFKFHNWCIVACVVYKDFFFKWLFLLLKKIVFSYFIATRQTSSSQNQTAFIKKISRNRVIVTLHCVLWCIIVSNHSKKNINKFLVWTVLVNDIFIYPWNIGAVWEIFLFFSRCSCK